MNQPEIEPIPDRPALKVRAVRMSARMWQDCKVRAAELDLRGGAGAFVRVAVREKLERDAATPSES